MKPLVDAYKRFVTPLPSVKGEANRIRARSITEMVIMIMPVWFLFSAITDSEVGSFVKMAGFPVSILMFVAVYYGMIQLCRHGRHSVVVWFIAGLGTARILFFAILGMEYTRFHFLILTILIISLLESKQSMILAGLQFVILVILPIVKPSWPIEPLIADLGLLIMTGIVLMMRTFSSQEVRAYQFSLLEESEERFRILFDTVFDALVIIDGECVVEANAGMARLFGWSRDELVGTPVNDLFRSETPGEALSDSHTGKFFRMKAVRKDGSDFVAELILKTQEIDDRHVQVLAVRDVTAEQMAEIQAAEFADEMAILSTASMGFNSIESEAELFQSLAKYIHQLNPAVQGLISMIDEEKGIMQICGMFGFGHEDVRFLEGLRGAPIRLEQRFSSSIREVLISGRIYETDENDEALQFIHLPPALAERFFDKPDLSALQCIGIASKGEIFGAVLFLIHRGTEFKRAGLISTMVHQASLTLQRLRAEAALARERDLLHLLMENVPDGIYFKDDEAHYTRLNAAQASLLGADTISTVVGKTDEEALAPGYSRTYEVNEDEVLGGGRPLIDALEKITDPQGGVRWLSTTKVPILLNGNKAQGLVGISRDITARHQVEVQLAKYADELHRSNQELQHFAYIASHDLQEPLRMISSYLQLLERRCGEALDEDGRTFIHFAVDGAKRLQGLINGLLKYSRVETRGAEFEPVELDKVLADTKQQLSILLKERAVHVDADELPDVIGDRTQLLQVFQNLIGNGVKFNQSATPTIQISSRKKDDEWVIGVKDNGIGIDPDNVDRIFKIFQRLHSREEYPGTGIGLAVCKKIVERHGGEIWVESQPGEGSTFYFTLPLQHGEAS